MYDPLNVMDSCGVKVSLILCQIIIRPTAGHLQFCNFSLHFFVLSLVSRKKFHLLVAVVVQCLGCFLVLYFFFR